MIWLAIIGGLMLLLALLYAIILLAALSGLSLSVRTKSFPSLHLPDVSVIIPVRNEKEQIIRCLESLISQDYPAGKVEVLISDDFSDDETMEVVHSFIQNYPQRSFFIVKGNPAQRTDGGKKKAIARAVDLASGSLILTTDADTQHSSYWISSMAGGYCETGARMILGPVMFSETSRIFDKLQTLEFLGVMGLTAGFANIGLPIMCNGANLCYEKAAFLEVGGFEGNERFTSGDDQFLLWKMKKTYGGRSIVFLNERHAIVTTLPEQGLRSFLRQRFRWISKSRGYNDSLVLFTGAINYLFQAMILTGFFLGFLSPLYLYLAGSLFCFKLLIDLPLVFSMARFFEKLHLWKWYIPAQIFQVIYVTISVPMAFLVPVIWKGRRVSTRSFRNSTEPLPSADRTGR